MFCRTPGQESSGGRVEGVSVHQDQSITRQWGGHLLPARKWSDPLPGEAWVSLEMLCCR